MFKDNILKYRKNIQKLRKLQSPKYKAPKTKVVPIVFVIIYTLYIAQHK